MQLSDENNTQSGYSNNQGRNYQDEVFTWKIKAGVNRIYYLNIKKDKNEQYYIVIKEVKNLPDGSKDVHRVMIFERDFVNFFLGMEKISSFINENPKPSPKFTINQSPQEDNNNRQSNFDSIDLDTDEFALT